MAVKTQSKKSVDQDTAWSIFVKSRPSSAYQFAKKIRDDGYAIGAARAKVMYEKFKSKKDVLVPSSSSKKVKRARSTSKKNNSNLTQFGTVFDKTREFITAMEELGQTHQDKRQRHFAASVAKMVKNLLNYEEEWATNGKKITSKSK